MLCPPLTWGAHTVPYRVAGASHTPPGPQLDMTACQGGPTRPALPSTPLHSHMQSQLVSEDGALTTHSTQQVKEW